MSRRRVEISGRVQGVGFRPFVARLAHSLHLAGYVLNRRGGVELEIEGDEQALMAFLAAIEHSAPPLARIDAVRQIEIPPTGASGFVVAPSDGGPGGDLPDVAPDVAPCDPCLGELRDPADRRYAYPFVQCCDCGPRLTLQRRTPYDRPNTTLAGFPPCAECAREYADRTDRRYHCEPIACPACGPRLSQPLSVALDALRAGRVVAIKGVGGWHLACDARDDAAVTRLRRGKERARRPFALLCDAGWARRIADPVTDDLFAPERPIVLLRRRPDAPVSAQVAPGTAWIGLMLPSTPLHHLLLDALDAPLVYTSANRHDEPLALTDADAHALGDLADVYLGHDRPIAIRCDDSVVRPDPGAGHAGGRLFLRRSRGYAPASLRLPRPVPSPTLAVGGHERVVFGFAVGDRAILSPHVGDLGAAATFDAFKDALAHLTQLFGVRPERVVHDLHPDYTSTIWSTEWARSTGATRLAVQHHHAHLAGLLAEHDAGDDVLGVTFDGSGAGTDGTLWGGEFLRLRGPTFDRVAHIRPFALPGGERAAREGWRVALALFPGGNTAPFTGVVHPDLLRGVTQALAGDVNCPRTSSVGRLFDAVAAIAGVCVSSTWSGEAGTALESLAVDLPIGEPWPFHIDVRGAIDVRPAIVAAVEERGRGPAFLARRWHDTLAAIVADVARKERAPVVGLTGGVFQNLVLVDAIRARLEVPVLTHRLVPPNDGGLAYGQLAASQRVP